MSDLPPEDEAVESTDFEITGALARELLEQGKCPTLERWTARAAKLRDVTGSPKDKRAAAAVARAFDLASDLVHTLVRESLDATPGSTPEGEAS